MSPTFSPAQSHSTEAEAQHGLTPNPVMALRFAEDIEGFLNYCAAESRAAFSLPAIARPGKSHKDAVEAFTCVLVDFDRDDPAANLKRAKSCAHRKRNRCGMDSQKY